MNIIGAWKTKDTDYITMLEGFFLVVAEAVFSYIIDKFDPAESIKKWLKREPSILAFQKALTRAYTAFARQYPEYTSSLFDQTFLTGPAAPELAKFFTRHLHPDPALFVQAWANAIGLSDNSNFRTDAIKPVSHFLQWLEAELKSETIFQPLFDSRALENLFQLESQIEKLTTELKQEFDTALNAAKDYEKMILEIAGDVNHSNIILGHGNQISVSNIYYKYYTGAFASLNDFYIPPDAVFQRVRINDFIGRDWLTAKVDAFLNDPTQKSGAFLLVGEAGVGKTSFMAHLVKERRYLHIFAEQVPGDANVQRALQSLSSQVITRYQIDPYRDHDTLIQLAAYPDFLDKLLRQAAEVLIQDEKIVLVCDALDEAGIVPDGNVFGLPNILPDNVYLILSQRPVSTKLPNINTRIVILEAQSDENLQDMEGYLNAVIKQPEISGQIRSQNYNEEFFVQTLKEKSLGVWIYLHYIIEEIRRGLRAPLELENLPTGLVGYYADYWNKWRYGKNKHSEGQQKWDQLYAPLLTTLAAAQEPITLEQLTAWAGINANKYEVIHLLQESWRSFLTVRGSQQQTVYSPYHASFRDFLTGKVDDLHLRPAESFLIQNLAEQCQEAHKRIIETFYRQCRGKWHELVEQDYPRLYLTAHLVAAGEFETLVNLLIEGDKKIRWAESRYYKEETYAGYLNDLKYVWNYAERENDLDLYIRCMLIENSIHSLATNISPELLVELAKSEIWSFTKCLRIISQVSKSFHQSEAIKKISQYLPSSLHHEALSVAEEIQSDQARAEAITVLLPYFDSNLKLQSLEKAVFHINKISDLYIRFKLFIEILPHLNTDLKPQALQSVLDALPQIDVETRARVTVELIPHLSEDLRSQVIQNALYVLPQMTEETRTRVIDLIHHLSEEIKPQVLQNTLDIVKEIINDSKSTRTLVKLIPILSDDFHHQLFNIIQDLKTEGELSEALQAFIPYLKDKHKIQAITIAQQVEGAELRASIFTKLLLYLDVQLKSKVAQQALVAAQDIEGEYERAIALASLIPYMSDNLKSKVSQDVLSIAQDFAREDHKVYFLDDYLEGILLRLMPHLSDDLKPKAISIVQKIQSTYRRTDLFIEIAPYLNNEQKSLLIAKIDEYEDEKDQARALIDLLPFLNEGIKSQTLQKILSICQAIKSKVERSFILIKLLPHLRNDLRAETAKSVLFEVKEIEDEEIRDRALADLLPHVSNGLKREVLLETLNIKKNIKDEKDRAIVLSNLIDYVDEYMKLDVQHEVLSIIQSIGDITSRAQVLIKFAPYLNPHIESKAVKIAKEITWDEDQAETLITFLPYLSSSMNSKTQIDALVAAQNIKHEVTRNRTLIRLLPFLSEDLKSKALISALDILEEFDVERYEGREDFISMLTALLPFLNDDLMYRALLIAQKISDARTSAQSLSALAIHLSKDLKPEALDIAYSINNENERISTLLEMLPHLDNHKRPKILSEILNAAQITEDIFFRTQILTSLIPYLNRNLQSEIGNEILATIDSSDHQYFPSDFVVAVLPYLDRTNLPKVLTVSQKINDSYQRGKVLEAVIPYVSDDLINQVLTQIKEIKFNDNRIQLINLLMPRLTNIQKQQVLTAELEVKDVYYRALALITLLPHLNDDLKKLALPNALESAMQIPWGEYRSKVLSNLLPHVDEDKKAQVLQGILTAIDEIEDGEKRVAELTKQSFLFEEATTTRILANTLFEINVERAEIIVDEWEKLGFMGIEQNIYTFLKKTAQAERAIGLTLLSKLLPAFNNFGEINIYMKVLRTVRDTARWWS